MNKLKTPKDFLTHGEGNYINCTDYDEAVEASQRYAKYIAIEFAEWRAENKEYAMCGIGGSFNNEFDQFIKERS